MRNYVVHTPLRGFRRAGGEKAPIGVDEVVALPAGVARNLLQLEAIQPTEADETCEIDWSPREAVAAVGAGIAAGDAKALAAALIHLGGIVFFPGEGLPDDAEMALADFSNVQLFDELSVRLTEGRLSLVEVPAQFQPPAPITPVAVAGDSSAEAQPPAKEPSPVQEQAAPAASTAPVTPVAKAPRKAKAAPK